MGMRRLSFFVLVLAVNDNRIALTPQFLAALPHLRHEGTGRIVAFPVLLGRGVDAALLERVLNLQRGTKSRDQRDIVIAQLIRRYLATPLGVVNKLDTAFFELIVDQGIVDDFAD